MSDVLYLQQDLWQDLQRGGPCADPSFTEALLVFKLRQDLHSAGQSRPPYEKWRLRSPLATQGTQATARKPSKAEPGQESLG